MVIVVSILLAFGIDAWWDGKQERRVERELLGAIQAEFSQNQRQLVRVVEHHAQIREAVATVLEAERLDCGEGLTATLRTAAWDWRTFNPINSATQSLIASGRLGLISDTGLSHQLAGWGSLLSDLNEAELRALEWRDVIAEYVAVNLSSQDCTTLLGDSTFLSLLSLRASEETEVASVLPSVVETVDAILAATM